jgi:hypothetical protein
VHRYQYLHFALVSVVRWFQYLSANARVRKEGKSDGGGPGKRENVRERKRETDRKKPKNKKMERTIMRERMFAGVRQITSYKSNLCSSSLSPSHI